MPQRRRDSGDTAKPLYASEAAERHPTTVHPIALPAGPAGYERHQPAPHTAGPRATYPPPSNAPMAYQTSPHAGIARPAVRSPVINMAEQLIGRPAQLRPPARPTREETTGPLLVIGGAEQMSPPSDTILARFVEIAGGPAANIAVIATASNDPDCRELEYQRVFTRLGAGHVTPLRITDRDHASSPEAAATILGASGVFFTGGDQVRITTVLGGSKVDSVLHGRVAEGMALAGTSAGAAMMSGTMIIGGDDATVSTSSVRMAPGLEFLPGVLIDMHFAARGRLNRLLSAVAMYPHELGLGIDEDTAILVTRDRFEVLGTGSVTVIDAGPATRIGTPESGDGPIAVHGMQLHVLPAGHQFHLTGRRPLLPGTDPEGT